MKNSAYRPDLECCISHWRVISVQRKKYGYIYPVMINTPQTKISLIILNLNISNDEDWYGEKGYSNS